MRVSVTSLSKNSKKSRNKIKFVIVDAIFICMSILFAFLLRYDFTLTYNSIAALKHFAPIVLSVKLVTFSIYGMYRGMWRYTSMSDLINIVKASTLGTMGALTLFVLIHGIADFPTSVILIDYVLTSILLSASRASVRIYFSNFNQSYKRSAIDQFKKTRKKLLMIGGGGSSEKIIREIRDSRGLNSIVVGILDDDGSKVGATIHGVPILGPIEELSEIKIPFDEVIICIPTATNVEMRRIVAICKSTGKSYRTVPTFSELIDGKVSMKSVREVSMVDLLGRKEVELDRTSISQYIYGKKVLVTGAGGSIGSELVRNCLTFDPSLLILLDQSEHNLFNIDRECSQNKHPVSFKPILGDIRDKALLHRVFSSFKPDVVFHAAAYKHVPMQEEHPWEAVFTNIQGTLNLMDVSEDYGVD